MTPKYLHRFAAPLIAITVAVPAFVGAASASDDETMAICAKALSQLADIQGELPPAPPGTVNVLMYKYKFCPETLSVKTGTNVRFINVEKRTSHSVWFKDAGQDESDRLFPAEFWEAAFDKPGRYPYLCGPHWEQQGMIGVLDVTD